MRTKTAERRLNEPRPIEVIADRSGEPLAVILGGRRLAVAQVQDRWRIDDEWWRPPPVSRVYWQVELEDGSVVTVHQDLVSGRWARQDY